MKKNLNERFAIYLKEVIEHYHKYGSLRNFSKITEKHKITAIRQDIFFKYGLHNMKAGTIPTSQQCEDILNEIRSRNHKTKEENVAKKEPKFKKGSIIAWKHNNGSHGMAYIGEDDKSWFTMNRIGFEGEEEDIRDYSELPYSLFNGKWQIIEPTKEDYERFIKALSIAYKKEIKINRKQKTIF